MTTDDLGLITQDPNTTNPLVAMSDPNQTTWGGLIDTVETWVTGAVEGVETASDAVLDVAGSGIENTYKAAKQVGTDVAGGIKDIVGFGTTQIVLILGAAAVVLFMYARAKKA